MPLLPQRSRIRGQGQARLRRRLTESRAARRKEPRGQRRADTLRTYRRGATLVTPLLSCCTWERSKRGPMTTRWATPSKPRHSSISLRAIWSLPPTSSLERTNRCTRSSSIEGSSKTALQPKKARVEQEPLEASRDQVVSVFCQEHERRLLRHFFDLSVERGLITVEHGKPVDCML